MEGLTDAVVTVLHTQEEENFTLGEGYGRCHTPQYNLHNMRNIRERHTILPE